MIENNISLAYKKLRDTIFEGKLKIIRDELIALLYKVYIHLLSKNVEASSEMAELLYYKRDFDDFEYYIGAVEQAIQVCLSAYPAEVKVKQLRELYSRPSGGESGKNTIELSRYSYEVIITFMEIDSTGILKDFVFSSICPDITKINKENKEY